MRTTLAIDDHVLIAVRERAQRENRTMGQVLSDLARQALTSAHRARTDDEDESFHGFTPLPHRGSTVTNSLIDQLRDEEPE
ncbi:antitoxin [Phytoactinopolyspora halotolerans]|uniref:Antitoxin n=1 Tax=Phytoactinopolyspora halotolerans TaxID=1981512 RepID=A0A6L9SEL9_9ACTN|nr:antitoxin [Phytoactinopolyspora halotolerans]NEE03676.1 antitoxin [Phytoactinopolyspora halotolerans]